MNNTNNCMNSDKTFWKTLWSKKEKVATGVAATGGVAAAGVSTCQGMWIFDCC